MSIMRKLSFLLKTCSFLRIQRRSRRRKRRRRIRYRKSVFRCHFHPEIIEKSNLSSMSNAVCTRLNEIHAEKLFNDHDTFLFDCDGVLWRSPCVLPGAIELLNYLTTSVCELFRLYLLYFYEFTFKGKRVFFVTNNSLKTQRGFAQWLNEIGYEAKPVSQFRDRLRILINIVFNFDLFDRNKSFVQHGLRLSI